MALNLPGYLQNDFLLFVNDGTAVSVVLNTFDNQSITVAGVTSSPVTKKQQEFVATLGIESDAQVFSLPVASLSGVTPLLGDTIVDGVGTWQIKALDLKTLGTRWVCICEKNRV